MDLTELDRQVLSQTTAIVAAARPADLDRPTPCAGWSLGRLLEHMVANHNGWVAAAAGRTAGVEVWESAELGPDPACAFADSAARVEAAFAVPGLADRSLPVYGYGTFPAPTAVGMHLVDYLVHGWDVAAALGRTGPDPYQPDGFDPVLGAAALRIARRWPYRRPDKAFGVAVLVPERAATTARLVGYLGRDPGWTATGGPSGSGRDAPPGPGDPPDARA